MSGDRRDAGNRWKWRIIILWAIGNKADRFGMLQRAIPGITKKMLTTELRALEEAGLISRTVFPVVPPKVEYEMTALGHTRGLRLRHWGCGRGSCAAAGAVQCYRQS